MIAIETAASRKSREVPILVAVSAGYRRTMCLLAAALARQGHQFEVLAEGAPTEGLRLRDRRTCVAVIEEPHWSAGAVSERDVGLIERHAAGLHLIPLVLNADGGFPQRLPNILWLRQAVIMRDPEHEGDIDGLIAAIDGEPQPKWRKASVFVSYHSEERPRALEVLAGLRRRGIEPWFDRERLLGGVLWQPAIATAVLAARSMLFLVGTRGLSKWQEHELSIANREAAPAPIFAILPGASRKSLPSRPGLDQAMVLRLAATDDLCELARLIRCADPLSE
jgi:hypothetical protein